MRFFVAQKMVFKVLFAATALMLVLGTDVLATVFVQRMGVGAANAPLRDLASNRGILIGSAVNADALQNDSTYRTVLAREFSAVTPENVMKWDTIHPQQNTYNFGPGDDLVNFAQQNNMQIRGHALVWHQQNPDWVTNSNWNRDQALSVLQDHINNVVGHYKGKVKYWDVVNEAIDDSTHALRSTVWKNAIGDDYIDQAFWFAHNADPDAKLFYNDYDDEGMTAKADAVYNMVKGMKDRGVPITGVGMQMHLYLKYHTTWKDQILSNMQRFAALGLEVQVTEMDVVTQDVNLTDAEKLQQEAQLYADVLSDCLAVSKCSAFVMWGFTDKYSWIYSYIGPNNMPLIYDSNYQPKPAYYSLSDTLAGGTTSPTPTPTPGGGGGDGTNLALNKPVTASSIEGNNSAYDPSKAVDGDTSTRWSSDFADPQWIHIDLGSTQTISRVRLNWESAYATTYRVETSPNDTNWTTVYSTTSGDGGIDDFTVSGSNATARYIRVYASVRATPWGYSLYEFEVYGSSGSNNSSNLALNKSTTASSIEGNDSAYDPSKAFDGNTSTRWSSDFHDPQWIRVDLGATHTITRVKLNWEGAYATAYRVETSPNDNNWTTVYSTISGDGGIDDFTVSGSNATARYIRVYATARATPWGDSLYEFEVYGS